MVLSRKQADTFSRQNDGNGAGCRSPRLCKMAKQITKSFFCFCLCAVLVFGTSYKRPVHGVMTGIAIGGAVIVSTCLAALGIGVSGILPFEGYNQACQNIWNGLVDDIKTDVQGTIELVDNYKAQFKATGTLLRAVFDGACREFPQNTDLQNISYSTDIQSALGWEVGSRTSSYGWPAMLQSRIESFSSWHVVTSGTLSSDSMSILVATVPFNFIRDSSNNNFTNLSYSTPDGISIIKFDATYSGMALFGSPYAVLTATYLEDSSVHYFFLVNGHLSGSGNYLGYELYSSGEQSLPYQGQDVFNPSSDKFYADGKSAMNTKVDDVIDGAAGKVGVLNPDTGETEIPLTAPNVGTADDPDVRSQSQTDVLGKDIADDSDRDRDRDTNKDRDTSAPKPSDIPDLSLPDMIARKFPFCLPFDLANIYGLFYVEPKAPAWQIPVDIAQFNVHQVYTFDLNQLGVLDKLLPIFKWFLNVAVILGLILVTRKIMS